MTANVQRKPRTFVRKGDHQPRFQPVISMRDPIITRHPPTIPVLTSVKPTPAPRSWTTNRNGITNGIHNGTHNGIPNGIHNGGLRNHNGAHHQQFEKQQNTLNRQRIFLFDPRNIESMDSSSMVCAFARPVNVVKIDEPIYETIYPVNDENCEKQESDSIDSGIKFIDGEGSDGTNFPNSRLQDYKNEISAVNADQISQISSLEASSEKSKMRRSKSHQQIIAASERCSSDKLSRSSTGTDEGNHSSETSQISHSLRATISSLAINQPRDVEVIVTHQRTPSELPPDQVYPTNERDGKGVESVGAINHVGCGGGSGETDDEERSGAKVEYATVTKSDKRPRRDNQQKSKWAERDSQREKSLSNPAIEVAPKIPPKSKLTQSECHLQSEPQPEKAKKASATFFQKFRSLFSKSNNHQNNSSTNQNNNGDRQKNELNAAKTSQVDLHEPELRPSLNRSRSFVKHLKTRMSLRTKKRVTIKVDSTPEKKNGSLSPVRPPQLGESSGATVYGELVRLNSDGSQVIEIRRVKGQPFGFFVARGTVSNVKGVFVSRMRDELTQKALTGLLEIGDEITKIDGESVKDANIMKVNSLIANKTKIVITVVPYVRKR